MITIETTARFEAAHRQLGDPGKCGRIHGHNWQVDYRITGIVVDPVGYLIDFKDLKGLVRQYDHKILLWQQDPLAVSLEALEQQVCRLPLNPTCENIAEIICKSIWEITMPDNIYQIEVTVWENHESKATAVWKRPA